MVAARTHTNALFDPQWFGKNSGTVTSAESDITVTTSAASTPGDEVWQTAIFIQLTDYGFRNRYL